MTTNATALEGAPVKPARRAGLVSARRQRVVTAAIALGVVLVLALGLLLRLWVLGRSPINSDQAVVGLMAREILHGHFFAFYWGQRYGGAEPYLTAALFAVFGQSAFTLGLTPLLLDAVAAVLVWRIGARLFGPSVGVGAALLFWVWPEVGLWQSTIEYGFRWTAIVCGLITVLITLRITDAATGGRSRPDGRLAAIALAEWIVLGGAVGIGWWATPEIAYYLVAIAVVLGWHVATGRLRPRAVELLAGLVSAGLGALPWLWDNVGHGFPSLHAGPEPQSGYGHHLRIFVTHALPIALGLRIRVSGNWLFPERLTEVLYALVVLALALWLVVLVVRRRAMVLVVFAVVAPFLYAYSPFTWYWADGRYGLLLEPVLALLVISGADALVRRSATRLVAYERRRRFLLVAGPALALAVGLALTLTATTKLAPYKPIALASSARTGWFSWQSDPNRYVLTAAAVLEANGIRDLYAGYWVAETLAFESRGALSVSDVTFVRYVPDLVAVEKSSDPAWLFVDPAHLGAAAAETGTTLLDPACIGGSRCLTRAALEDYLTGHRDSYRVLHAGDFVAVVPYRAVSPGRVLAALHIHD